jgi:hypothetical protein
MKRRFFLPVFVVSIIQLSCAKQACDGTGPCNYPRYVTVPALSEKNKYCRFTVIKRIDCSTGPYALDCDDVVCIECETTCPSDSIDAAGDKFLKMKYKKDDYIIRLGTPSCGVCTTAGLLHLYKER